MKTRIQLSDHFSCARLLGLSARRGFVLRTEDLSPVCAKSQAGFYYAHTLCGEGPGRTHGILQSGLPPGGGIPAMPPTFLRNVWERGPPLLRRSGGGGRIPIVAQNPSPQSL